MLFTSRFARYTLNDMLGDVDFGKKTYPINTIKNNINVEITQLWDCMQVIKPKGSTLQVVENVKSLINLTDE